MEYAWNITELRRAEKVFAAQIRTLMDAIPDAQGIFRFDVTQGRCLSVSGVSRNISAIRQDSMAAAVESMAAFVPGGETRRQVFAAFCREAMQTAYARGDVQVVREADSFFDDGSTRSVRLTARLTVNPTTGHLECVLYGMDISDEKRKQAEYEAYIRQ